MYFAPQELRTYFVTAVTARRRRLFQVERRCELMLDVLQSNREKRRLQLHVFVLMPDHIHLVITPANDVSLEKAMQYIKGGFSFQLKSKLDVWERSFNQTQIRDALKFESCKRYIEHNPVRKGIVTTPEAFAFSSASRKDLNDPRPAWFEQTAS